MLPGTIARGQCVKVRGFGVENGTDSGGQKKGFNEGQKKIGYTAASPTRNQRERECGKCGGKVSEQA
ncbi:hypothetical protein BGU37_18425 [Clostridioides difficile]|nr:hypothetical protein BGU37_18425 [Clostridioides difficile]